MGSRPQRNRRASAPIVPSENARQPPLRVPSLSNDDKDARRRDLEAFLGRLNLRKGHRFYYTLNQWWRVPLPKASDDAKGSKITFSVLQKVMEPHFQDDEHQKMIDRGYASASRTRIPGRGYLGRIIDLPQVLKYLVIEKGFELRQISSLVPRWKSRYATYVSTVRCERTGGRQEQPISAPQIQPEENVMAVDDVNSRTEAEIATEEADDILDLINDDQSTGGPEQPMNEDLVTELEPETQTRGQNHPRERRVEDEILSRAAATAIEGTVRHDPVALALEEDSARTPDSVRTETRLDVASSMFLGALQSCCTKERFRISQVRLMELSKCLASICDGTFSNFKLIYSTLGVKRKEKSDSLREVLETNGITRNVDLMVSLVTLWMTNSLNNGKRLLEDCDGGSSNVQGERDGRAEIARSMVLSSQFGDDANPWGRDKAYSNDISVGRDVVDFQANDPENDAQCKSSRKKSKRRRKNHHNTVKSLLLVLFYSQKLGLAENVKDEEDCGIKRSLCSGHSLGDIANSIHLPISRAMAYRYKAAGEKIVKVGKDRGIRKLEERELLRLPLSRQTSDEIIKQREIGSDNSDGTIVAKFQRVFDLNEDDLLDRAGLHFVWQCIQFVTCFSVVRDPVIV